MSRPTFCKGCQQPCEYRCTFCHVVVCDACDELDPIDHETEHPESDHFSDYEAEDCDDFV